MGRSGNLKGDVFAKPIGSKRTYQKYSASYNGQKTFGACQVLTYRATGNSVSDTTPLYDLCIFCRELKRRLGLVGFAGVGGGAPNWGDFRFDDLLPAAGAGLRFNLDKKNHINYRIDVGYGRAGHTISMSVTEAF